MLREKVARARWVVAISEYNRQMILDLCGNEYADRIRVVHCGVDTERLRPHREDLSDETTGDRLRVACTGTLHEVKGQKYLVDACQILVRDGIDVELHLIGDGPDHRHLRHQVKEAGLSDRVVFYGRCTQHEVRKILGAVDLLAAPSVRSRCGRQEGIPVALMEAMACGVPVVASRLSGIPELVEHERTGLLVPAGDTKALAEAMRRLLTDTTTRERLSLAGREFVEQKFDLGTNAAALATLFAGSSQQ